MGDKSPKSRKKNESQKQIKAEVEKLAKQRIVDQRNPSPPSTPPKKK